MNDYEKAREERIKQNQARLAELQVCGRSTARYSETLGNLSALNS